MAMNVTKRDVLVGAGSAVGGIAVWEAIWWGIRKKWPKKVEVKEETTTEVTKKKQA